MKALSRDKAARYGSAREMADAIEKAARAALWSQQTRADFVQRHFEVRQADITALLGDPASTDLGDLLPEASKQRVTRDEFRTVQQRPTPKPLAEERTVEVRTRAPREARPPPGRKMPIPPPGYPDDEPATVLGPPPTPDDDAPAMKRRTEPALDMPERPPIDMAMPSTENRAIPDEGRTVIEGDDSPRDDSARATDESSIKRDAHPGPRRLRNLAAQKQALLMWIAIGSGLVLGLVLAAFLIFG
ncbi:MAG: hypothetical protein IPJ65_30195 [Archangiaceae bacterium]|nr:hypothetical protein [Archangiaceae bacterium]